MKTKEQKYEREKKHREKYLTKGLCPRCAAHLPLKPGCLKCKICCSKRGNRARNVYRVSHTKQLVTRAKYRAKKLGLSFTLDEAHIIIPAFCPVLGMLLKVSEGHRSDNSASIDRMFPEQGYVPSNINIISWRANKLKNDATYEELEKILAYMKPHREVAWKQKWGK